MPVRAQRRPVGPPFPALGAAVAQAGSERLTRYLRAATQVAADLSGCMDERQALQTVCDAMVAELDATFAGIWFYVPGSELLVHQAEARQDGFDGARGLAEIDLATSPTSMAAVAKTRQAISRNRLADGPDPERHWRERDGINGVAVFPLLDADGLLGVLAYFSGEELHGEVLEVLGAWATIVGAVVQNVRLVEREQSARAAAAAREAEKSQLLSRLISAQEDERTRLAGDLHDGPIQALAVLLMKQNRAVRLLGRGEASTAIQELEEVQQGMMQQVTSLRRQMVALRPHVLDERGLVEALHVLAGEFRDRFGRECSVRSAGAPPLAGQVATALFRIAQEAIVNAGKHAAPSTVDICLTRRDDDAVLVVADRGPGFAARASAREFVSGHYGLASMRERAEASGGLLSIDPRPGGGALVTAVVPLGPPSHPSGRLTGR
jgi:signal transduction histidine kinase